MRIRTLIVLAVVMLVGALTLRFAVIRFGWLPVSEEAVLKKAVALKVTYYVSDAAGQSQAKSMWIDDSRQLSEALAMLHMGHMPDDDVDWDSEPTRAAGQTIPPVEVLFMFDDILARKHLLEGTGKLGGYEVDRTFYDKLCEFVSKLEGRKIIDLRDGWNPHCRTGK